MRVLRETLLEELRERVRNRDSVCQNTSSSRADSQPNKIRLRDLGVPRLPPESRAKRGRLGTTGTELAWFSL